MAVPETSLDRLLDSYMLCGGINHLDGKNLPSKPTIGALTEALLQLVFPGFWEERTLARDDLREHTERQLELISTRLEAEIAKSFAFRPADGKNAADVTRRFLGQLSELRDLINTDVLAALEGDPAAFSVEEIVLAYPGIQATAVQRMAHRLFEEQVPLVPRIMTEWVHSRTGIDIHPGAHIGTHFFIDHGTGVVIGQTTHIGNRVRIYQGVTLGALSVSEHVRRDPTGNPPSKKRHPTIEDDVTIYAGATILGGETVIGRHSVIGGNVWITESVPPECSVTFQAQQLSIKPRKGASGLP